MRSQFGTSAICWNRIDCLQKGFQSPIEYSPPTNFQPIHTTGSLQGSGVNLKADCSIPKNTGQPWQQRCGGKMPVPLHRLLFLESIFAELPLAVASVASSPLSSPLRVHGAYSRNGAFGGPHPAGRSKEQQLSVYSLSNSNCLPSSSAFLSIPAPMAIPMTIPMGSPIAKKAMLPRLDPNVTPMGSPNKTIPSANHLLR